MTVDENISAIERIKRISETYLDGPWFGPMNMGPPLEDEEAITAASSASLGPNDVTVFSEYWQEEVDGVLTPYVTQVYTGSAATVAVGVVEAYPDKDLPGVPLIPNPASQIEPDASALLFLSTVSNSFAGVGDDVWEDVRDVLINGVKNGESTEQIAAKIKHITQYSQSRATQVARTVVHSAAESGSIAQLRMLGYGDDVATKEWLSTHDGRTRPTHQHADKQKVGINERFTVGASTLDFPGDPSGSWAETRQCRCTALFDIDATPSLRCGGVLVASVTPTHCVTPIDEDVTDIPLDVQQAIFSAFSAAKISPAYGGAKIHKVIAKVREDSFAGEHGFKQPLSPDISEWQILAVVDKFKTGPGGKFTPKYAEWLDTAAGKKAAPLVKSPTTHAVAPSTSALPQAPTYVVPKPLPDVAPKPDPKQLTYTGKTLGSHGARVYVDTSGNRWLFKPQQSYATDLDIGTAKIQSKALQTRPGVYEIELGGEKGSIQYMFDSKEAFPGGSFDPLKLSAADLQTLQEGQIFDWLISNFDTHSGQWIRLSDGSLFGTDKGQAFKFFGQDVLDWKYVPVTPLGSDKLTYQRMWQLFVLGEDVDLKDPTTGALGAYIDRLMAIPDAEYRKLLQAYAQAKGKPSPEAFLAAAVARKNALKADFADFWSRAMKERAKHVTVKPVEPVTVVDLPTTPSIGTTGDISWIPSHTQQFIWNDWIEFVGGGTKVTPAWGGSKIWKQLETLLESVNKGGGIDTPDGVKQVNHLQLLRILDQQGGFKGKAKTYESELLKWLDSPAGKKAVPSPPKILKPTSTVTTPVTKPAVEVGVKKPGSMSETTVDKIVDDYDQYANGDEMAFGTFGDAYEYRIVKRPGGTMDVQIRSTGKTTWENMVTDVSFVHPLPQGVKWYKITPNPTVVSKIPGKQPGDALTATEIEDSRFLWSDGETIATAIEPHSGAVYRVTSDGKGGFVFWRYEKSSLTWTKTNAVPSTSGFNSSLPWKLGGDTLSPVKGIPTKPSILTGHSAGDLVDWDEVKAGTPGSLGQDAYQLAYAYDAQNQIEYSLWTQWGHYAIKSRAVGGKHWDDYAVDIDSDWTKSFGQFQWYAATKNGDLPDVVKAMLPGAKPVAGMTTKAANQPGLMVGDVMDSDAIVSSPVKTPGMVIATKTSEGVQWRVIIDGDAKKVLQKFDDDEDDWVNVSYVNSTTDIYPAGHKNWAASELKTPVKKSEVPNFPGTKPGQIITSAQFKQSLGLWDEDDIIAVAVNSHGTKLRFVSDGKGDFTTEMFDETSQTWKIFKSKQVYGLDIKTVAPSKTGKTKSLLKGVETHVPGKTVGDTIGVDEILTAKPYMVDGQIIATAQKYGVQYRVFVANGKLLQQKLSKSGVWGSTKIIDDVHAFDVWTNTWKASNEFVTPQHLKNAVKFVDKKVTPASQGPAGPGVAISSKGPLQFAEKIPEGYTPLPPIPEAAKFLQPKATAGAVREAKASDLVPPNLDLSGFTQSDRDAIVEAFRLTNGKTTTSPELLLRKTEQVLKEFKAKGVAYKDLTLAHVLRFIDEARDKRLGNITPSYTYEKIVVKEWVRQQNSKTPTKVEPQVFDAPILSRDLPPVMHRLDAPGQPDPDKQKYRVLSDTETRSMQKDMEAKYGAVTPSQRAGVSDYTGGHFREINHAVRDGKVADSPYATNIQNTVLAFRPSTSPIKLLRATGWSDFFDDSIRSYEDLLRYEGRVFAWRRMVSTTIKATRTYSVKSDVVFHIEAPIGTPMVYAQAHGGVQGELEMILAPHTLFRITKIEKRGSTTHVTVRVVGALNPGGSS